MSKSFSVAIALPGMQLLTFEAKTLTVPGHNGAIGIMAGRQSLLTTMDAGFISIVDVNDEQHLFATTGGFCEMLDNKATLLCDSLLTREQIDLSYPVPGGVAYYRDTSRMKEKDKRVYVADLFKQKLLKEKPKGKLKNKGIDHK